MSFRSTALAVVAANIRFDPFVLDLRSHELRRGDRALLLQPQPFEILRMLLDRPGKVVEREELRRRLWPDGTFVDYEHSLNAAVKRLRQALGDDAARPRFVETVPRHGYRFVAPLDGASGSAAPTLRAAGTQAARLAVLPLTHPGDDGSFADGLTEELIAQVAQTNAGCVSVIARTSSMLFKGVARRASEIGEALGAHYLLEGSVRTDGDRVRITAWLVETASETHVWCEAVESTLASPLSAQVEVATRLAQSIARTLRAAS